MKSLPFSEYFSMSQRRALVVNKNLILNLYPDVNYLGVLAVLISDFLFQPSNIE